MPGLTELARSAGLHRNRTLRRIAFAALKRLGDRDIGLRHHWTPGRLRINAFRHRGYWFHGRRRESGVMESFARLIRPGDTVIEVGGHIGYISMYLSHLVGPEGQVHVFEPSDDNLRYLRANTARLGNVQVHPFAISDRAGTATFYVEALSGQNSSLVEDYGNFADSKREAFSDERTRTVKVETITLDGFLAAGSRRPAFIKIDIEGAEMLAVRGMDACLTESRPRLMIELTEQVDAVMELMRGYRYLPYSSRLEPLRPGAPAGPNRFFIPEELAGAL